MSLSDKIKRMPSRRFNGEPVWKGPQTDGITFSLLSRYLADKERFRIKAILGLVPAGGFNHRLEYGTMWHLCEEWFAKEDFGNPSALSIGERIPPGTWRRKLQEHCTDLCKTYRRSQEEILKWYNVCLQQFPLYVKFWESHEDVKGRLPLLQEYPFNTKLDLPSGRWVGLRGKWDSVDLISGGVYLQENKTKGDVYEPQLLRQLTFDLQTMIYLTTLSVEAQGYNPDLLAMWNQPIRGVRYNVVRRPLSGGKGTIKQKQGETSEEYYGRLAKYIQDEPASYFMRWMVAVSPADLAKFRQECLDPVLENLLDDYEWWKYVHEQRNAMPSLTVFDYLHRAKLFSHHASRHYREPFGVYNPLDEGGSTDLDEYLATGSEVGLERTTNLFPELS